MFCSLADRSLRFPCDPHVKYIEEETTDDLSQVTSTTLNRLPHHAHEYVCSDSRRRLIEKRLENNSLKFSVKALPSDALPRVFKNEEKYQFAK